MEILPDTPTFIPSPQHFKKTTNFTIYFFHCSTHLFSSFPVHNKREKLGCGSSADKTKINFYATNTSPFEIELVQFLCQKF